MQNGKIPEWLQTLFLKQKAGTAHLFVLWGNIHDLVRTMDGDYVTLYQYLADIFEQRDLVMFYSLSAGLQFATADMEKIFRSRYLGQGSRPAQTGNTGNQAPRSGVVAAATAGLQSSMSANAPLSQLIGDRPEQALRFLEVPMTEQDTEDKKAPRKAMIINSAQNIAPNDISGHNASDRINVEILERWSRDESIREAGNIVIMITPTLASLSEHLRGSQSGACAIRIRKPNEEERTSRWEHNLGSNGVKVEDGLRSDVLGRITNGMSLFQIDGIYREAKADQTPISLDLIKARKQAILEAEFGDRIRVKVPQWGFSLFGGKEGVKNYMLEIRDNITSGMTRRVPMGILASGPPGTGKTFFFECWAYECGFNFVEITNPKEMWVGKSEENMERIFAALDDLSPVIVVEDEADQSEPPRDAPDGSSGVNPKLRQMKFQFTSDPRRRGKVIWVRISNRDDLIDAAYKRKGRTDDSIPFILPGTSEYPEIFRVMFERYGIPTDVGDFAPFAEKVAEKAYCTGADVEWMVLEADKYAGRAGQDTVSAEYLYQAIDDWEMDLDPRVIDHQTILAIKGSSKRLRPDNWQEIMAEAQGRLQEGYVGSGNAVFPGVHRRKEASV